MTTGSLMKVDSIAERCNTFDLHYGIIGLENQFIFFISIQILTEHSTSKQWRPLSNAASGLGPHYLSASHKRTLGLYGLRLIVIHTNIKKTLALGEH